MSFVADIEGIKVAALQMLRLVTNRESGRGGGLQHNMEAVIIKPSPPTTKPVPMGTKLPSRTVNNGITTC